jgi:recombination protein RecT
MSNTTALTTTQQKALDLRNYLTSDRVKEQIAMALPKWLSPDRFLRVIFGAALRNPKIMECSIESILQAVMMCAQLGLEPILGRAHLIPYWNGKKRCLECQFQPGYQGLTDLARRSGGINDVYSQVVYEHDFFEIEYGTARKLTHRPTLNGDPGNPIGSYAVWEFKDGTKTFEYMPLRDIEKRRNVSQSYQFAETGDPAKGGGKRDSVWHVWTEDMMRKTVVKHSAKLVPSSIEFMEAVQVDDAADSGRRVTMFQGVPMIEDSGAGQIEAPEEPAPWCDEILSIADDSPRFDDFVKSTLQANRSTEADIRKAANENPAAFIAAHQMWVNKQSEATKPRKPRSDKGVTRKAAEPIEPQEPAVNPITEPEPSFPPEEARAPGDEPNVMTEELLMDERRAELAELEKNLKYYVLEAKKRTGIAHPTTLTGYDELIRAVYLIRQEKQSGERQ